MSSSWVHKVARLLVDALFVGALLILAYNTGFDRGYNAAEKEFYIGIPDRDLRGAP